MEMKDRTAWTIKHPLIGYFLLAYLFSWSIEIPLALQAMGALHTRIPFSLHYLSGYGPLLAALIMTWRISGKGGLRELLGRVGKWRVRMAWWLVALSPLIALILVSAGLWMTQGATLGIDDLGRIDHFPAIGLGALPLWILTFGLGEETGWRGFALPNLQRGRGAFSATLILWGFWALWHLPLFFYMYTLNILPGFLIGLLAGAITFTWIFNSTGGSVLMTVIWHGTYNYATACSLCKTGPSAAVISTLVMIWAVLIVLLYKPATLSTSRTVVVADPQMNVSA
jgi:membrane protease YdiL (CAAX protease family)